MTPTLALLVIAVFAGMTLLLGWTFDQGINDPGDLDCTTGAGVYTPPCPQQFTLVWVLAAQAAASLVLAVVVWRWRRALVDAFPTDPPGARWLLGAKRPVHVVGMIVFFVIVALQLPYGPNFDFARSYGADFDFRPLEEAIVRGPIWLAAAPVVLAAVTIFDIYEVARHVRANDRLVPPNDVRVERLVTLRRTLDNSLSLLGLQLGLWVVSHAAVAEYVIAVANAGHGDRATATELTAGTTILVMGAVVTAIVALLYVPTALAVDAVAAGMLDDADRGEVKYDDLRQRIGVEQSVQDRLAQGLSIAAPLAGAVVTTFVL